EHERPDGDLCGTALALKFILSALGRTARVVLPDEPPERYRRLDGAADLEVYQGGTIPAEVIIVLDSAGLERLGPLREALPAGAPVISIDHHLSNNGFGDVSWVDPARSSTGEMVYDLAKVSDWPLPLPACSGLYAAILTDTGRFGYSNTSAGALRAAAELVERGVSAEELTHRLYSSKTERELRLLGRALSQLRIADGGRMASIAIYARDFREFGAVPADAQDFAARTVSVAGVELGFFLYELEAGKKTKVSVRSSGRVDASELAGRFGGGGHRAAAGLALDMGLDQARSLLEEVGREFLGA
ncbi:MAG TPA: DHHA1 domain-containing protein, partial [Planctomycetota bacterium]|nr:DHHA1 domain-containing protein [Planctomycetota bacterium]